MTRGRRAEPLERQIAKGNAPLAPGINHPPGRVESIPTPPPWLMESVAAVEYWSFYTDLLFRRGQLSQDSTVALMALVQTTVEWAELARYMRQHGYSQDKVTPAGDVYAAPLPEVAAFADCDRRLRAWLAEFGLTDASRGKVAVNGIATPLGDDPLSRYNLQ